MQTRIITTLLAAFATCLMLAANEKSKEPTEDATMPESTASPAGESESPGLVLSSDWEAGEDLTSPWEAHALLDSTKVIIDPQDITPFDDNSVSVVLEDGNQAAGGPGIHGVFAKPQAGPIRISFDFKLPQKSTNHPTMVLEDSQGKQGLFLTLDNNHFPPSIPGNNIVNRSALDKAELILPLRYGEWHRAELLIWPPEVGRYTITATQYGGEPVRVEALPFREKLADFAAIRFLSNSSHGTGTLVIANVKVEAGIDISKAGELQKDEAEAVRAVGPVLLRVDSQARAGGDGSENLPFATVEEAQMKIREMKRQGLYPAVGITVELASGIYYRTNTWKFSKEDSGRWNAPVIYRAEAGGNVTFHGGRSFELSQFQPVSDPVILKRLPESSRASVVQLDLSAEGITDYGELPLFGHSMSSLIAKTKWRGGSQPPELFFNGEPMTLARWPNEGFARVGRIVETGDHVRMWMDDVETAKGYVPESERHDPPVGFAFRLSDATERLKGWSQESDLRLLGYWFNNYSDQAVEVAGVDPDEGIIRSRQPSAYSIKENQRFFAYNALSELDVPGEWYLDRRTGVLYLYPTDTAPDSRIELSFMKHPLLQTEKSSFVHFEGLTFVATRSDGVIVSGGEGVVMDRCRVGNVGKSGVQMLGSHHRFLNGEILQTGGAGITLSGGDTGLLVPSGNEVLNSHIHSFGRILKTYQPGVRSTGVGNRVAHCEINSAPHVAILIGGNSHLIELNYIHDVAQETDDMAAIYGGRSWFNQGTVIRHNLFHNITGYRNGTHRVSGIYLDDGYSGTSVLGNVFLNLTQGILFNGGRENRAEGNLFIDVENMMRATDMTDAYQTWAVGSYRTLNETLARSPYLTPLWKAHFPRLSGILEDEPNKPKYSVIRNNLRFNTPMIIGPTGIHNSFIDVGWVENNPEIAQSPGSFDPQTHRFVPDVNSGLFKEIPALKGIPFQFIGRYDLSDP